METLVSLLKLTFFLVLGVLLAKKLTKTHIKRASIFQSFTLYGLLFSLGIEIGAIDKILEKLQTIGGYAFTVSLFNVAGSCLVGFLASLLLERKYLKLVDDKGRVSLPGVNVTVRDINTVLDEEKSTQPNVHLSLARRIFLILREPLFLISIVILGMLSRLFTPLFNNFSPNIVTYLLYALLFFSGIGLGSSNMHLKEILSSPLMLLLPLWTLVGTYLGALFVPLVTHLTLIESLGISSGFGWYSLSGILITDLGFPLLGSIAFLSNVFRESLTFFLVPLFGKLGRLWYYPAVCAGGATTMDVTLPLLSSEFGSALTIPTMYHGVVMTLLVPLLIPLFF